MWFNRRFQHKGTATLLYLPYPGTCLGRAGRVGSLGISTSRSFYTSLVLVTLQSTYLGRSRVNILKYVPTYIRYVPGTASTIWVGTLGYRQRKGPMIIAEFDFLALDLDRFGCMVLDPIQKYHPMSTRFRDHFSLLHSCTCNLVCPNSYTWQTDSALTYS